MLEKLAYYIFVFPLSLLPLSVLYLFTDFFYLLLVYLIPYRRKVVRDNIEKCFPNSSEKQHREIEKKFYRHLTNLLAEGVKNLSIRKIRLKRRIHMVNRDLIDQMYIKGKSVLIVGAHYGNWEWMVAGQNFLFAHQALGIGMPLTSKFWDKKINQRRARFGMKVVHAKNFRQEMENQSEPISLLVLSDQSPTDSYKSYWTTFMGRQTACLFGAEMIAHEYDMAVVYVHFKQTKRGFYELRFEEITSEPKSCEYGEITEKHLRCLEKDILEEPSQWMWSHKRWKREIPEDLEALREKQKQSFYEKMAR
ncbi:MAG: lysophospholipid acyltransferase family protein [Crocinitomicaceae bacterium]|jgi:KDO2-lipid IV(A) lauroyltransferase|nr:lysophospholipid acyltransferase family protein [Crocinitomicaceae bacterium]